MDDKELTTIMDSIQEKVGKDISATIQDDLGLLITGNTKNLEELKKKNSEIEELKSKNSKLIDANARLFAQIPDSIEPKENNIEPEQQKAINIMDAFDEKGNFKK